MKHEDRVLNEAVKISITTSLGDFFKRLGEHDWYSSFSDSFDVQKLGDREFKLITKIASTHPKFKDLLDKYRELIISNSLIDFDELVGEEYGVQTSYKDVRRSKDGVLLRTSNEHNQCSDIWDNTTTSDGHFSIDEVDGKNIGVFPSWDIALSVAAYTTSFPDGGFDDVIIKNVSLYSDFDDWL